ncbi:transposase [Methylocystis sp. H62]|nr:transposase [Methylocystis sp. H62]
MRSDVQKKTAHASEQDRPDVKARREAWFESQLDLDPERLVFIDETWTTTNMARKCGREQKGERLRASVPHGHWKTTTFIGGLRCDRMTAPMVLDGPVNGQWFQAYVDQVLVPTLSRDDIVIMDNLGSHKGAGVRKANRGGGRDPAVSPALQPRRQSDRKGALKTQGPVAQGRRANRRRARGQDRPAAEGVLADRMRKLLRRRRI